MQPLTRGDKETPTGKRKGKLGTGGSVSMLAFGLSNQPLLWKSAQRQGEGVTPRWLVCWTEHQIGHIQGCIRTADTPPPPDESDHRWKKRNLPLGKSGRHFLVREPLGPRRPPPIVVVRSPCQENYPADAHPSAHKAVLGSANPAWTRSVPKANKLIPRPCAKAPPLYPLSSNAFLDTPNALSNRPDVRSDSAKSTPSWTDPPQKLAN